VPWEEEQRGGGGVEGDDGAVCEAGAFAEGGWSCLRR